MRQELTPLLFVGQDKDEAEKKRENPVAKAEPSDSAIEKLKSKKTADGYEVNSFNGTSSVFRQFLANLPLILKIFTSQTQCLWAYRIYFNPK